MKATRPELHVPCDDCVRQATSPNAKQRTTKLCSHCISQLATRKSHIWHTYIPVPQAAMQSGLLPDRSPEISAKEACMPNDRKSVISDRGTIGIGQISDARCNDSEPFTTAWSRETDLAALPSNSAPPPALQGSSISPESAQTAGIKQLLQLTRAFVAAVNARDFYNPIWFRTAIEIKVDELNSFIPTKTPRQCDAIYGNLCRRRNKR